MKSRWREGERLRLASPFRESTNFYTQFRRNTNSLHKYWHRETLGKPIKLLFNELLINYFMSCLPSGCFIFFSFYFLCQIVVIFHIKPRDYKVPCPANKTRIKIQELPLIITWYGVYSKQILLIYGSLNYTLYDWTKWNNAEICLTRSGTPQDSIKRSLLSNSQILWWY